MFAILLQRAALLIGADYRPRDCTHPMRSWKSYISQDHHWYNPDNVIKSRAPFEPIATDVICMYILWGILYTQYRTNQYTPTNIRLLMQSQCNITYYIANGWPITEPNISGAK